MTDVKRWFLGLDEAERATALGEVAFYLTLTGRDLSLQLQIAPSQPSGPP
jgi:hypothetical protein